MKKNELIDIIVHAFKNALKGKIWRFFLSSLSVCIATFFSLKTLLGVSLLNSFFIGFGVLFFLFLARFGYFFLKGLMYALREAVYGEAIIILKDTFALIHFLRKQDEFNDKLFMETMTSLCTNLKIIFDKITNANCSVSIKVSKSGPITADTIVENLCRDTSHTWRDTQKYRETNHIIIGNTPFVFIVNNVMHSKNECYYLNNSISTTTGYQNTSKDAYQEGKLPYESELVYPIIPIRRDSIQGVDIRGFLCIDCNQKNKFTNKYNIPLIAGVADGIHDVILMRNNHFNNK